jgi:dynein heavy chain, axonemal
VYRFIFIHVACRQLQGKSWIKAMERDNDLLVTTLQSKLFRQQLEDSISFGRTLLIEDVEEDLDSTLDHVLEKTYVKLGSNLRVCAFDANCSFAFDVFHSRLGQDR